MLKEHVNHNYRCMLMEYMLVIYFNAYMTFNILMANFYFCPKDVKATSYEGLLYSDLEYSG